MDADLVMRARDGDEAAFAALTALAAPRLLRVAAGILRDIDRAEDATQQALVRIWRQLPSLRDPTRFEAWSYRVLVNACRTEGDRARRSDTLPMPSQGPAAPGGLGVVLDRDELERGFERLSLEQRAVIVLHLYVGLGNAEVAQVLGIPEGTVRSRLHSGIHAMRAALMADARPSAPIAVREEGFR
ncbi:MAG: RNA polymerase sigma factor [Chloroflexota bacterium]|jgi:RNA polymerase sigma-70 factor (ECF subfamily)